MYTISDLHSLDVLELMRIATELGVSYKKTDSQESIIYAILDKQAELSSTAPSKRKKKNTTTNGNENSKASEKPVKKAASAKRQSTKSAEAEEETKAELTTPQDIESVLAQFPKHRGRKSKAELAAIEAAKNALSRETEEKTEKTGLPLFAGIEDNESFVADTESTDQSEVTNNENENVNGNENENTNIDVNVNKNESPNESEESEGWSEESEPSTEEDRAEEELLSRLRNGSQYAADADDSGVDENGVWQGDPGDGTDFIVTADTAMVADESEYSESYMETIEMPERIELSDNSSSYTFETLNTIGVLELNNDGSGYLRSGDYNYLSSPDDVLVSAQQVKRLSLKTGDVVACRVRIPREGEKCYLMDSVDKVNGCDPAMLRDRIQFENLTPLFPEEKFTLCGDKATTNMSTRIVDLFSPIGKGQRALIVAQPKTGKTILMKDIANAIAANHPEAYLMMLLIDERPEEVTDMARTVKAEVIASTFDEPADRHVKIANLVLEKAKRLVECGHDVVIFLDSITRLARAYNTVSPTSGRILSGGVEATALQKPKRFFGAARNIEGGGSLTIIATALIDTGSKMDEVIFEEFKGTGNMELQLERLLSNKRIFPAVNLVASSTRRDDLLQDRKTLDRMWILRKHIAEMNALEAMKTIYERMQQSENNDEFLVTMNS